MVTQPARILLGDVEVTRLPRARGRGRRFHHPRLGRSCPYLTETTLAWGAVVNQDLYDAGLATRRRVLGDAHVDASLAAATEFSRDIQDYVTQYCWGDLWNRPGLSLQERSLINLSMIIALNRSQEFKAHVRGAVNNGVSREQIKEVLMQSAFYCGGPAALEAFRNAAEVFAAMDAEAQAAEGAMQ
jgi:4-carboxymuconolactone decarboxylase